MMAIRSTRPNSTPRLAAKAPRPRRSRIQNSATDQDLTGHGRAALGSYTQALRDLLGGL